MSKESEITLEPIEEETIQLQVAAPSEVGLPEERELTPDEDRHYLGLLESVLFLASEPLGVTVLARKLQLDRTNTRRLADRLVDECAERDGGIVLREIAGGYRFSTAPRYSNELRDLFQEQRRETLSRAALETLSIICYKQPITLPEIEDIRGVGSRSHIAALLARTLIKSQGYRPVPGRPTLYVTTRKFLEQFALNSLTDLPALEEVKELRFDDLD